MIRTVTGDVPAIEGPILAHEHLQIDLCCQKGAQVVLGEAELEDVVHDLGEAMRHGLKAVVDLSVLGSGRNPRGLKEISERLRLPVVCAAGFYWDPDPPVVHSSSVAVLRELLMKEVTEGIEGTGIRAGVIKVGTHHGPFTEASRRAFEAAAQAGTATGAAVVTHTASPDQATWHLDTLERAGMDPSRVLISHMGAAQDIVPLREVARRGAMMGIDKVGFLARRSNVELADLVRDACEAGLERHLILSSDVARKDRLLRRGGSSYGAVFVDFIPMLRERGIEEAQINVMMCRNPARLLRIEDRP